MHLPLPKKISENIKNLEAPNLSLMYYKWADVYNNTFAEIDKSKKKGFFNSLINLSKKSDYINAFSIRKNLLEGVGISFGLTTASRLVCGMGYDHPLENGFMFDWTSGLPVIPGSSLKGIALDCCPEVEKKEIFGSEETGGQIIFFPAYPCLKHGQGFLELDVMTPHYQPYYSDPKKNPPADWYSPVPLHFLTVPEGIKYCFRLANRNNLMDKNSPLLIKAKDILIYALTELGVGAKTSVFYGYFK